MLAFLCPFTSRNIEPHVYPGKHKSDLGDNLSNFSSEQCIFVDYKRLYWDFFQGNFIMLFATLLFKS